MAEQKQKEKDGLMREHKKSERERMKSGKKQFHIKKCKWNPSPDRRPTVIYIKARHPGPK